MRYLKILILSILIFCSISFVTIINDLNIPALGLVDNPCTLKIGFPYTFYHQFLVESPIPNSGWGKEIIIDYFFAIAISIGLYYLNEYLKRKTT